MEKYLLVSACFLLATFIKSDARLSGKFLLTFETSRTLIIFNEINKDVLYKMHALVFIVLGSVLATSANAGVGLEGNNNPGGVGGCTGKAIFEPNFKRGDIE